MKTKQALMTEKKIRQLNETAEWVLTRAQVSYTQAWGPNSGGISVDGLRASAFLLQTLARSEF